MVKEFLKQHGRTIFNFFKVAVAFGILYFLFYVVNIESLGESFSRITPTTIVGVTALYFLGLYVSVLRWQILIKSFGITLSDKELFRSYLIGSFVNNFLPSSVGGDVSKIFTIEQAKDQKVKFATTVIGERVAGVLTALIWGVIGGVFLVGRSSYLLGIWVLLVGLLGGALILLLTAKFNLKKVLFKFTPDIVESTVEKYLDKIGKINLGFTELLKLFLYSTIFFATSVISLNLYLSDLGYDPLILPIIFTVTSVTIVSLIPISLNALGLKEAGYVAIFSEFGIGSADSLAISLISRVLLILYSLIGGVLLLLYRRR